MEFLRAQHVAQRVVRRDLQALVGLPRIRIAHAHVHGAHLFLGLGAGRGRHPVELVDAALEGGLDVGDHLQDARLVLGREVLGDVHLADGFVHRAIGGGQGALPARRLLRRAGQALAVELEAQVGIGFRQRAGELVQAVEGQVVLPGAQVGGGHLLGGALERPRVVGDEAVLASQARALHEGVPVHARRLGGEVLHGPGIVGLLDVGRLFARSVALGQS